ncbi:c-type cytochrome [Mucilaginibacter dorajii]|uniref:Cytochrome c domain-containing protein n=1 Tax=Mucilaginibacter dorajii TaxID=692994 RepID=A0ABP7QSQ0_9SPHI|nr:cytochrome c [Mucilaginibacter dorajii]MCS3736187.1 mono/diheme cytochrome c family protein [Mucilaginibacter dorajii]
MDFKKALLLILTFGLFTATLQAQTKHKKTTATHAPSAALKASIAAGLPIFTENCVACHQADGTGIAHMNPPLIKTPFVLGDKTRLIKIILNGFNDDVEINGERYSNTMASHDFLSDQQIADLLTYVRNSFGNKASAITMAQVKAVRAGK